MLAKSPGGITDCLDAIARLAPLIAEHCETFDSQRRLPDVVFNALADAGLFRLWLPGALGGPELSPADFMTVVEAAAAVDGSIGWLVGNGAGMSRIGGYLPELAARQLFAGPRSFIVTATGAVGAAQKVEGGYRVTGRWPFGSGAHHASHFMGLASTKDADGNDEPPLCCYFERRDVASTTRGVCRDCAPPEAATSRSAISLSPSITRTISWRSLPRKAGSCTACLQCRCSPGLLQSFRSGRRAAR